MSHKSWPGGHPHRPKHKSPSKVRRLARRALDRATTIPLEKRSMDELKGMAKQYGVTGYSKMRKQALCDAIRLRYLEVGD